jgi:hypothetical protein
MKIVTQQGKTYRLSGKLTPWQQEMHIHLINWKWRYFTKAPGKYLGKDYDAILPNTDPLKSPLIYPDILPALQNHHKNFRFKFHKHFNHMASSQAAAINLFLPILQSPEAENILKSVKPDLKAIAIGRLDKGFQLEFWGDPAGSTGKGLLGDHNNRSGTDADIAIAYYNDQDELCLWLIEHKLTEAEFTECGGKKSNNRKPQHDCYKSFDDILKYKNYCYYHDIRNFEYWNITDLNKNFFNRHYSYDRCPFIGGWNQLWRNQLLGLAIEKTPSSLYKHVYFSVVRHPNNTALNNSLNDNSIEKSIKGYLSFIGYNPKFSHFTSADIITATPAVNDPAIRKWCSWYRDLYMV